MEQLILVIGKLVKDLDWVKKQDKIVVMKENIKMIRNMVKEHLFLMDVLILVNFKMINVQDMEL